MPTCPSKALTDSTRKPILPSCQRLAELGQRSLTATHALLVRNTSRSLLFRWATAANSLTYRLIELELLQFSLFDSQLCFGFSPLLGQALNLLLGVHPVLLQLPLYERQLLQV